MTFKKGVSGNPSGRPKKSKSKIGLDFVLAMQDSFKKLGGVKWLCTFADKNDENRRAFMQTMARFIPAQTLQMILMEDAREQMPDIPKITFVSVDTTMLENRVAQLEKLLTEHRVELPRATAVIRLPEKGSESDYVHSLEPVEDADRGEKPSVESDKPEQIDEDPPETDPFRALVEVSATKRAEEKAEKKRREASRGDDDSWMVTAKDDD